LLGARRWGLLGKRPAPRTPRVKLSLGALATPSLLPVGVELATGIHLPVEGWADARIGQSLKINIISLTIAKS